MENEDLDLQNRQAPSEKSAMGSLLHQAKAYENDEELAELKAVYANGRKAETLPEFKAERILTFLATDETPDRAGDIVRVDGGDVKRFMQNPVFLVQHRALPVARVLLFRGSHHLGGLHCARKNDWRALPSHPTRLWIRSCL